MSEEIKPESVNAGSSEESKVNLEDYVSKEEYANLEKKLGDNSAELGSLRTFFETVKPLMEKLEEQPDLLDAIVEGKVTAELVQAVEEGKISLEGAKEVIQAHTEVKEELGKEKYEKLSPDAISKMIEQKLEENIKPLIERMGNSEKSFNKALKETKKSREFEDRVNDFVKNTPDFQEYAEEISKWLDEHPKQFDVDVAYYAVKGQKTTAEAKKEADEKAAEEAKKIAANAGLGGDKGSSIKSDPELVDSLFADYKSPNL